MKIAVIGYGSLINHLQSPVTGKTLEVKRGNYQASMPAGHQVKPDSPFLKAGSLKLPVRLGRVSGDGTAQRRITAILDRHASDETVYFAKSKFADLNLAINNLRQREGIPESGYKNIGYVNLKNHTARSRIISVAEKVAGWAVANGFDAVIWTDLPSKGVEFGPGSTGREILPLLASDPVLLDNTKKYIADMPSRPNLLQKEILAMCPPSEAGPSSSSGAASSSSVSSTFYEDSLTADFEERDRMPQTHTPKSDWFSPYWGLWGPFAAKYPKPVIPAGVDPIQWKRDRIIATALKYTGLKYKNSDGKRGHFPARGCGLDCSNFASWVYNYGLGIQFTSDVNDLADLRSYDSRNAGRALSPGEPLEPGDLILMSGSPKHVVIYVDEHHVIDSTSCRSEGVGLRDIRLPKNRWYTQNRICVRRPIE